MPKNIEYDIGLLRSGVNDLMRLVDDADKLDSSIEHGLNTGEMQSQADEIVSILKDTVKVISSLISATAALLTKTADVMSSTDKRLGGR